MDNQSLQRVIESSTILVHPERYAYLKCSTEPVGSFFLVSKDSDEITVVAKEEQLADVEYEECTRWFTMLEIKVAVPFISKGFLARVSAAIANEELDILLVSTYSKDYALVRTETAHIAVESLRQQGFPIEHS
jgi:hypothetical protein